MDHVAIKVTRGLQKYREEALIEIDVLREVGKYDKSGKRYVIAFRLNVILTNRYCKLFFRWWLFLKK